MGYNLRMGQPGPGGLCQTCGESWLGDPRSQDRILWGKNRDMMRSHDREKVRPAVEEGYRQYGPRRGWNRMGGNRSQGPNGPHKAEIGPPLDPGFPGPPVYSPHC